MTGGAMIAYNDILWVLDDVEDEGPDSVFETLLSEIIGHLLTLIPLLSHVIFNYLVI
jgi:hypothetical protein